MLTAESDQTLNTPSPINVPPTTLSNFLLHKVFKSTPSISSEPTTTQDSNDLAVYTPTTIQDSTNENYTFNTLLGTELPTDPMPPSSDVNSIERIRKNEGKVKRRRVTNKINKNEPDFMRFRLPLNISNHMSFAKQIPSITTDPVEPIAAAVDYVVSRNPCSCEHGICKCCTGENNIQFNIQGQSNKIHDFPNLITLGMILSTFNSKGCAHIKYDPEQFSFELKMMMNDRVLYKNRVSGKNPPPICINPRRLPFIEVCVNFYDIYFIGRNMHMCMEMNANFNDFEVFNRDFQCMRFGTSGVGLAEAGDNSGLPVENYNTNNGGFEAEVDQSDGSDIDEYDENVRKI
uniref:CSON012727 protein n=1 Tax=Culicoides sonorensis TaxID=179676 RepID=A0A336M685_CULSO